MNRVYIHVAAIGSYQFILAEIMEAIRSSGLGDCVCIGLVGDGDVPRKSVEHLFNLGGVEQFEFPTLSLMQACAKTNEDDNFLYLHTKGASTTDNPAIDDWRKYMTYFCVEKWQQCNEKLAYNDCVGVDWRIDPVPHYSGNFWWATGKHLASLPDISRLGRPGAYAVLSIRHNAEFWIGMNSNAKPISLWDCGISQYSRHLHRYPRERYVNG